MSEKSRMKKVSVFRKEHFNAAHRLHNPGLSDTWRMPEYLVSVITLITTAIIMT